MGRCEDLMKNSFDELGISAATDSRALVGRFNETSRKDGKNE